MRESPTNVEGRDAVPVGARERHAWYTRAGCVVPLGLAAVLAGLFVWAMVVFVEFGSAPVVDRMALVHEFGLANAWIASPEDNNTGLIGRFERAVQAVESSHDTEIYEEFVDENRWYEEVYEPAFADPGSDGPHADSMLRSGRGGLRCNHQS